MSSMFRQYASNIILSHTISVLYDFPHEMLWWYLCVETVIVDLVREEQFIYGPGTLRSTNVATPQLPSSIYLERTVLQLNSSQVGTKSVIRWTFQREPICIFIFIYISSIGEYFVTVARAFRVWLSALALRCLKNWCRYV